MKRFYKDVTVREEGEGYAVLLDGRAIRTPARRPLLVPYLPLAELIAAEWRAQGEKVEPETMPQTKMANVVIDGVNLRQADIVEDILGYTHTDLLCYWAEHPAELCERQTVSWGPILDWLRERYGIALRTTSGVMPCRQDDAVLDQFRAIVAALNPWQVAALHMLTTATGSLVLALAVFDGHLTDREAARISLLDETYQAEQWGEDVEARTRRDRITADIAVAAQFLSTLIRH